jgi:hypothetical protein
VQGPRRGKEGGCETEEKYEKKKGWKGKKWKHQLCVLINQRGGRESCMDMGYRQGRSMSWNKDRDRDKTSQRGVSLTFTQ